MENGLRNNKINKIRKLKRKTRRGKFNKRGKLGKEEQNRDRGKKILACEGAGKDETSNRNNSISVFINNTIPVSAYMYRQ